MGSRIVFFLTEDQAQVLVALHRKKPAPDDAYRAFDSLRKRGLLSGWYGDAKLTPLGRVAAKLAIAIWPASQIDPASRPRGRRRARRR